MLIIKARQIEQSEKFFTKSELLGCAATKKTGSHITFCFVVWLLKLIGDWGSRRLPSLVAAEKTPSRYALGAELKLLPQFRL